ncbi:MAG: DUF3305 domain-containing protein [Burkholderiales bacterium]|nr:DUF3305 domain-containing protein [Burkholderiales bacterium]
MLPVYFSVDVVMDRLVLDSQWATEQWQPSAVEPVAEGRAVAQPPQCIAREAKRTSWRFPGMEVELHASEGEGFYLNLTSGRPVAFVMWRMHDDGEPAARPLIVTLSYNQAGRFMDGGERVDNVPLAEPLRAWLADYTAAHYKPEPRKKARRNDPFADGAFKREPPRR